MIGEDKEPDRRDARPYTQTVFHRLLTLASVDDPFLRGSGVGVTS